MEKTQGTLLMDTEVPLLGVHPPVMHSEDASKELAGKVLLISAQLDSSMQGRSSPGMPHPYLGKPERRHKASQRSCLSAKGKRQVSPEGGGINSR